MSDPHFEIVLTVRYPSLDTIEVALASFVRAESRELTERLLETYEETVFHTLFNADDYPMQASEAGLASPLVRAV